jgi:acylphosphatase
VALSVSLVAFLFPARGEESMLKVDKENGRILLPGKVLKQGVHAELKGAIEYIACGPGGKEYEALFSCPADPKALHAALVELGIKPGKPAQEGKTEAEYVLPEGGKVRIWVEWTQGVKKGRESVESFVLDTVAKEPMKPVEWVFTGSQMEKNPETGEEVLGATQSKNLIALHHLDATVLIQNPLKDAKDSGRYKANLEALPKEGSDVTLVLEIPKKGDEKEKYAGKTPRIHWIISGKLKGVGFREYVERIARENKIRGWVRMLPDETFELAAEGTQTDLRRFRGDVRNGPRGAKNITVKELDPPTGSLGRFEIQQTPQAAP